MMLGVASYRQHFYFAAANGDSLTRFPARVNPPPCKGQHLPPTAHLDYPIRSNEKESLPSVQQALWSPMTEEVDHGGNNDREHSSEQNSMIPDLSEEGLHRIDKS